MRAPAVAVLAAGKFFRTAQLRPGGKSPGIVGHPAIPERSEDVAAAGLIPKEMRRRRDHGRIGRFGCHPVDTREMKAADAARLVATGAGDVVEPPLKAGEGADVLQARCFARRLL